MSRKIALISTALTLGVALAAPSFVTPAFAQSVSPARERAIHDCMAMQRQHPSGWSGMATDVQWHYRACMADHGQPE